jgi:hypothetical protein
MPYPQSASQSLLVKMLLFRGFIKESAAPSPAQQSRLVGAVLTSFRLESLEKSRRLVKKPGKSSDGAVAWPHPAVPTHEPWPPGDRQHPITSGN